MRLMHIPLMALRYHIGGESGLKRFPSNKESGAAESDAGGFLAFEFEAVLTPLRSAAGFWSSTVGSKTW